VRVVLAGLLSSVASTRLRRGLASVEMEMEVACVVMLLVAGGYSCSEMMRWSSCCERDAVCPVLLVLGGVLPTLCRRRLEMLSEKPLWY